MNEILNPSTSSIWIDPTIIDENTEARSRLTATKSKPKFAVILILCRNFATTIKTTGLNLDNRAKVDFRFSRFQHAGLEYPSQLGTKYRHGYRRTDSSGLLNWSIKDTNVYFGCTIHSRKLLQCHYYFKDTVEPQRPSELSRIDGIQHQRFGPKAFRFL